MSCFQLLDLKLGTNQEKGPYKARTTCVALIQAQVKLPFLLCAKDQTRLPLHETDFRQLPLVNFSLRSN